jgi:hypothetical protein
MDNRFIFLLEENLDSKLIENFINNVVNINNEKMDLLFECLFNNYLLILFTITCFSTIFCCQQRTMYKYKLISQEDIKEEFVKGVPV